MKDSQNITIALLLATAGILIAMLIATYVQTSRPAYADSPDRRGNYVIVAGAWSASTDLVYMINIAHKKLNVYYSNQGANTLELIDDVDLGRAFDN